MKRKLLALLLMTAFTVSTMTGFRMSSAKAQKSVEAPYELTMAYVGNAQPDMPKVVEKINELTVKKLNIKVNIIQLGYGDFQDKLKLMLSGGDKLDVFPIFYSQASSYINAGQIVDMKDLVKKYGTGIINTLGKATAYAGSINGFLYGFPAQKESAAYEGLVMRKDIVEKYKIDLSKVHTMFDLTAVFSKIKAGEPNMNMIVGNNIIDQVETKDTLFDNFGVLLNQGQDVKVKNWYESDEFTKKANLLRDWYKKGYVMKDAATTTESNANLMKAGNTFSYVSPLKPGFLIQEQKLTGRELVTVPLNKSFIISSGVDFFNWGIAQNSKNPVKAMQFLNFAYTNADFMNLLNWGIKGVHYKLVDKAKGIIDFPDGVDATNAKYNLNIGWELPNQFLGYIWNGNDPTIWKQYKEFNDKALKSKAFGFIYDSSKLANELTALNNVSNQYVKALNTGSVEPATVLPQFNKALYSAGLQKVMNEKQKQLNAWLAKKK